jgi:thiol-disulfide isomerase/thioredoxin
MSAGEVSAIVLAAASLMLSGLLGWVAVHLAQSLGRLRLAMDELQGRLDAAPGRAVATTALPPAGLPIGRVAPSFEVEQLDGRAATLSGLLDDRMLLLAFVDPECAPCRTLLPDLADWQRSGDLKVVPISRGTPSANRREMQRTPLRDVGLQKDGEVATAFEIKGTPSAVLIAPDGRIASPIAAGPDAIRELVARAPRIAEMRASSASTAAGTNGNGEHAIVTVGDKVPLVELQDLDGKRVVLGGVARRSTMLLFWRPSCSFCERMIPEVKQWAAAARTGQTDLLLVALDDRESNAALDLGARIALDPEMKAFNALGASGTPIAVTLDSRGRVASPLAAGTEQVRALAAAAGLTRIETSRRTV